MVDFVQSNYNTDTGTAYPLNIDQGIAALSQRPLFNRILNGDWQIDQVNEGALYTVSSPTPVQTVDGWSIQGITAAGVFKVRRLIDPDFASQKCLEVTCTTADASIAAGDLYFLFQNIEGYDVADLRAGLATASKITIAFDMKFSVTGVYGISLRNSAANRAYVGSVTQNVANTRESKVVQLTLDTTGTWLYDTGIGLQVAFCLAAGSTYQGTAGAWGATNIYTISAQANFMSSTSNIGYLGPISLLPGTYQASSRGPMQGYADQLRRSQRQFWKTFDQGVAAAQNSGSSVGALSYIVQTAGVKSWQFWVPFPVPMRAAPSATFYNPNAANTNWRNSSLGADSGAPSTGVNAQSVANPQVAGDALGNQIYIHASYNARLS